MVPIRCAVNFFYPQKYLNTVLFSSCCLFYNWMCGQTNLIILMCAESPKKVGNRTMWFEFVRISVFEIGKLASKCRGCPSFDFVENWISISISRLVEVDRGFLRLFQFIIENSIGLHRMYTWYYMTYVIWKYSQNCSS